MLQCGRDWVERGQRRLERGIVEHRIGRLRDRGRRSAEDRRKRRRLPVTPDSQATFPWFAGTSGAPLIDGSFNDLCPVAKQRTVAGPAPSPRVAR
jgi:hypothetical protein